MEKKVRALRANRRAGSEIWGLSWNGVELPAIRKCVQGEVAEEAWAASQALRNFPGEEPDSCFYKRDPEMKLGLWETQGKRGRGWLCEEENERFSEAFGGPQPLLLIPAGVCLASM